MSSAFRRSLPPHPDLDQQRKLARELLRAYRAGDSEAIARMRTALPDLAAPTLTAAQYALAREYGFASWRELKERIEQLTAEREPPIERFKHAVHRGDAAALRAVLERHAEVRASVNAPIFAFDAPALVAVNGEHLEAIDALLEGGADPNRRSDWWAGAFHPLHVHRGEAATRLLAAGAVLDACAAAHLDRADLLAAMLAEAPARVHERGGDGQTPLHFARSRVVVDLLLAAGADLDARDVDHRSTPAQWMIGDADRVELAAYLVERGASADIFLAAALGLTERVRAMLETNPSLLRAHTSVGEYAAKPPSAQHIYQWTIGGHRTPLHAAAKFGRDETVAVMERYATPVERLLIACHRADRDAARAVLTANPGLMASLDPMARAALADEAWSSNAPAVELMLDLGFDPAAKSRQTDGGSALHAAAWQGAADCAAAILRHPGARALLAVKDPTYQSSPLGWCCHGSVNRRNPQGDYPTVARLLIDAGAPLEPEVTERDASEEVEALIEAAARSR
jgi:ankyrin repeat protein